MAIIQRNTPASDRNRFSCPPWGDWTCRTWCQTAPRGSTTDGCRRTKTWHPDSAILERQVEVPYRVGHPRREGTHGELQLKQRLGPCSTTAHVAGAIPRSNYSQAALQLGAEGRLARLEVGGGGGSVACWLSAQVGAQGRVVATDIDARFLNEIHEPNFEVWKHDIAVDDLPTGEFDLVHTRWVLQHLADPRGCDPAYGGCVATRRLAPG
jgi:Methyltransferase domain